MALINCPDCNTEVSDKASQCPRCAYPISTINKPIQTSSNRQFTENVTVNVQQPSLTTLVALTSRKSEGISFVLTFFFGPFGLIYGNPKKAGAVIIFTILSCFAIALLTNGKYESYYAFAGFIGLISWIASMVLGSQGVHEYNSSLLETDEDKALEFKQNLGIIEQLRKDIKEQKSLPFYAPSKKQDIINSLKATCIDKTNTEWLINEYTSRFSRSLVVDLECLTTDENERKEYTSYLQQEKNL